MSIDSPLPGWTPITADTLSGLAPLSTDERRAFFHGTQPRFRHAVDPDIPRRAMVGELVSALQAAATEARGTASVLVGLPGEGKTTALLQVAADLARAHGWTVYHRESPTTDIDAVQVAQLEGGPSLLVFDHVDMSIEQVSVVCRLLALAEKTDVHLLAAARTGDWRRGVRSWRKRGRNKVVGHPGFEVQVLGLGGLVSEDAAQINAAWQAAGTTESVSDLAAVDGEATGSFLDASLRFHFDEAGMDAYAEAMIAGLEGQLRDALLTVAAGEVGGFAGVHPKVLADRFGVGATAVWTEVVTPLGDAGAVTVGEGVIQARHHRLAQALVRTAAARGDDLTAIYRGLVEQVVETGNHVRLGTTFGRTLSNGRKLEERLPSSLDAELRARIAAAVAEVIPERPAKAERVPEATPAEDGPRKKKKRRRKKRQGPQRLLFSYAVKPERVAENEALLKAVHAQLAVINDPGVRYATFREDETTFVHLGVFDSLEKMAVLEDCAAYRAFSETLPDRTVGRPSWRHLDEVTSLNLW